MNYLINQSLTTSYITTIALGVFVAGLITGFPGVSRTPQPVLAAKQCELGPDEEEPSPIKAVSEHLATAGNIKNIEGRGTNLAAVAVAANQLEATIDKEKSEKKKVEEEKDKQDALQLSRDEEEILWLARILYSETKLYDEQYLIAWIVRNRVDTGFRGNTYKEVALAKSQFSGLHPTDRNYRHNISQVFGKGNQPWQDAVSIAREVYYADGSERPLPITVRHFYSPLAVTRDPHWAIGRDAVQTLHDPHTNSIRFALYDGVK